MDNENIDILENAHTESLYMLDSILCTANTELPNIITLLLEASKLESYSKPKLFLFLVHLSKHNPHIFALTQPHFLKTSDDWILFISIAKKSQIRKNIGRSIKREICLFIATSSPESIPKKHFKILTKIAHPPKSSTLHFQSYYNSM